MQRNMQQLLNLMIPNYKPIKTTSINLSYQIITSQQFDLYSPQLRAIYQEFFNNQSSEINLSKVLPLKPYPTKMPICNKILHAADLVYKCYDCFLHQSAVLCQKCFENGQHTGHRYKKISSGGGNCDCGNPQALKSLGFCKNHSGKAEIPYISPQEIEYFMGYMVPVMDWLFKLKKKQEKQTFSQVLLKFLIKLNEESLYYNFLTEKLLASKRQNQQQTILQQSFHLKNDNIIKKFSQLYFAMFTLESFKITLADAYLTAYNTINQFQTKSYHSLYIQLFANQTVVLEICKKYQNTLKVTKNTFDYQTYLEDICFISSIQEQPAFAFYELYFHKNSTIPFPPLDVIQTHFEKIQQIHIIDTFNKTINQENFFYTILIGIATKIKNNPQLSITFTKGIFLQIQAQTYSYSRNKAVIPYHRAFAISLFALFKGNIEEMSISSIASKLQINQQRIIAFYKKHTIIVINCLIEFSETYTRNTYFDNYINLYAKSGIVCVNYDYLFIRQASEIMKKQKMFIQLKQFDDKNNETLCQKILKHIILFQLLIQACVSDVPLIILNQKMSLNNPTIKNKRKQLFISILKILKSVNLQQLGTIGKYFINQIDQKFLFQNTIYNKTTKKYNLKPQLQQNSSNFNQQIYISKKKTHITLFNEYQNKQQPQKVNNHNLPIFITQQSIINLTQQITKHQSMLESKQLQNILHNFKGLLHSLQNFNQSYPFIEIYQIISSFQSQQYSNFIQNQQNQKQRKQKLVKKRIMEMNKKRQLTNIKHPQIKEGNSNPQNTCLLCLQQKNDQILSYFVSVKSKQLRHNQYQHHHQNQPAFIFTSCFHKVHESCLLKHPQYHQFRQNKMKCPLCKVSANLLLPVYCQYMSQSFKKILQKISQILRASSSNHNKNKSNFSNPEFIFHSFMSFIIQSVGYIGVFSKKEFQSNFGRVCLELTKIIKVMWDSWNNEEKQKIKTDLLQSKKQINSMLSSKDKLFLSVNQYITHKFLAYLELSIEESQEQVFTQIINYEDLQAIESNMSFIFNKNFQKNSVINSKQKGCLKKIIKHFNYYIPPSNVKQLLTIRDQTKILKSTCKPGHNVLICCLCQKVVCQECKCLFDHAKQHNLSTVYFSFLNGSLLLSSNTFYKTESFYQNSLGLSWTPDKEPNNFELNLEDYNSLILSFLFHCMNSYVRKAKKMSPANLSYSEEAITI